MRRLAALAMLPLLVACAGGPEPDATALETWTPIPDRATEVACGDLWAEWADGTVEAPERCWTFEETDALHSTFRTIADSYADAVGGAAEAAPACAPATATNRAVGCSATWRIGDRYVTVATSVTLSWLQESVAQEPPVDVMDPGVPGTHELTVWIADAAPVDEMGLYTEPV
ncbi:hypothetical protein [Demequina gelatinilytica]|uniref:hypothetical protein n=1 Tax=Demequina gelatinilytica TaxID=1638980 RepID=UPI000784FB3B|nr:hypothetical protein [Demequina gelatinilytica]